MPGHGLHARSAPDLGHLKPFGFAPGTYSNACMACTTEFVGAKRAIRCRECAEEAFAKVTPPAEPPAVPNAGPNAESAGVLPDADYRIGAECQPMVADFGRELSIISTALAGALVQTGMTTPQALNCTVQVLVDCAAGAACRSRRELLGGEPDPVRWRAFTDDAFARAVKRTAAARPAAGAP